MLHFLLGTVVYLLSAYGVFYTWAKIYPPRYGYFSNRYVQTADFVDVDLSVFLVKDSFGSEYLPEWRIPGWSDSTGPFFVNKNKPLWRLKNAAIISLFLWWAILILVAIELIAIAIYKSVVFCGEFLSSTVVQLPSKEQKQLASNPIDKHMIEALKEVEKIVKEN